jgi:Tol biopolymer transport system component
MTDDRRFDRNLPGLLTDLASPSMPSYRDDIVQRTALTRQRPAWIFPERWLPVDIATRRSMASSVAWRPIGVVLALLLLLVAAFLAISIGSQQRLPAPYGLAANGLIVYSDADDVYVGDATNGLTRPLFATADREYLPTFSRDGTRLALMRKVKDGPGPNLVVSTADGRNDRLVSTEEFPATETLDWSGDGRSIVISSFKGGARTMTIVDVESGTTRDVDVDISPSAARFLPPTGTELVFLGRVSGGNETYAVSTLGGTPRLIAASDDAEISPDGALAAYCVGTADGGTEIHLVGTDGKNDRVIENPPLVVHQCGPEWSPDGEHLVVFRAYDGGLTRYAIIPLVGGAGVETDSAYGFGTVRWSPDGKFLAINPPGAPEESELVNIATGDRRLVSFWITANWQRVAP